MKPLSLLGAVLVVPFLRSGGGPSTEIDAIEDVSARNAPLAPIEFEVTLDAPREAVWHAWATNEGAKRFFAPETNIEIRPGGPYEIFFMPDAPEGQRGVEGLEVLSYIEGEMLSFEWNAPSTFAHARPRPTFVVVRLEELEEGATLLRFHHGGFAARARQHPDHADEWKQVRAYFVGAWRDVVLARLVRRFSHS